MDNKEYCGCSGEKEPIVSIIVPVYNAQDTVSRCIESILKQSYKDFELILVDDGSQDASGEICDRYASEDDRIHVIHKENTGVSDSRNIAIREARGKYLQFVDADDWVSPEASGILASTAESNCCDLVISDFYRVVDNRIAHKGDIQENGLLSRTKFAEYMMENPADYYYGVLWNKLYRKALVEEYKIKMDSDISWCEDFMFNLEYICHAERIYVLRVPVYYYVKTKHSLSTQGISIAKTIKMKTTVFEHYNRFYKEVFNEEDYKKSRIQVYRFFLDAASDGVVPPALLPGAVILGEERPQVNPNAACNESIMQNIYLERKCLEACLQFTAFSYDLTPDEVYLLMLFGQNSGIYTRKELADFIGRPKRKTDTALQKLKTQGYITWKEHSQTEKSDGKTAGRQLEVEVLPAAEPVLESIKGAQNAYYNIIFSEFTEEEITQYEALSKKLKANILNMLM